MATSPKFPTVTSWASPDHRQGVSGVSSARFLFQGVSSQFPGIALVEGRSRRPTASLGLGSAIALLGPIDSPDLSLRSSARLSQDHPSHSRSPIVHCLGRRSRARMTPPRTPPKRRIAYFPVSQPIVSVLVGQLSPQKSRDFLLAMVKHSKVHHVCISAKCVHFSEPQFAELANRLAALRRLTR